jgi:hypothetical protein
LRWLSVGVADKLGKSCAKEHVGKHFGDHILFKEHFGDHIFCARD